MLGWKEFEMEVVRDRADNAIIICSIEMSIRWDQYGRHITVAPALTLTDKEYQRMRSAAIAVLREIGVETGGSNVQFAVDSKTGRMVVIEMGPECLIFGGGHRKRRDPDRESRCAPRRWLHARQIANDITGGAMPASFEPTIDYVVTKIPRLRVQKFRGAMQS